MTPADHANTVRDALRDLYAADGDVDATWEGEYRDALAALDALQTQAETAAQERLAFVEAQTAMRERAEAAEAERDHARDALREAQAVLIEISSKPYRAEEATAAYFSRAALGDE